LLLGGAENGKVFLVPLITPSVIIISRVVP
jgi:hypothetical protein